MNNKNVNMDNKYLKLVDYRLKRVKKNKNIIKVWENLTFNHSTLHLPIAPCHIVM